MRGEGVYWAKRILGRKPFLTKAVANLAAELDELLKASGPLPAPAPEGLKVALVSGNGLNTIALSMDALWGMALRLRGHNPVALICGEGLASCEFNIVGPGQVDPGRFGAALSRQANGALCATCTDTATTALEAAGLPLYALTQYAVDGEIDEVAAMVERLPVERIREQVQDGIPVGDHAFSSTLRITLRGEVDLNDPYEVWVYRRQLISAILMTRRAGRFLDVEKPDRVVCIHGVYLKHGTLVDLCNQRNIPVCVYGVPYRLNTVLFSHRETYHRSLVTEPNSVWEDTAIDDGDWERLRSYLESKVAGGRDYVNYHPNPILDRSKMEQALGLDPNKKIVSLYTNVIWDAQIYYEYNAFENIFDWLYSTIRYFEKRPDLQLVIRVHPAEVKGGSMPTRQPITPEIQKIFPTLPANVFLIPPESNLSSYTLAEASHAALIYGTKMGLEIAYRGIPVIVAGETFNRGKGFTYDIQSREEYFALLDRVEDLPRVSEEQKERVRRFANYLFFRRMMDMPLIAPKFHRQVRDPGERYYTFNSLDELAPGRNGTLDAICDGITKLSPFMTT
ncbi:hypothetical protein [Niveispirillum irakense]|uniref:hypothetical protein n=1 Tax=Niveispirillum irakense TaxID=34011 RepID=UPI0006847D89|nr:hypothetical protein [Niveispirillum irakense]